MRNKLTVVVIVALGLMISSLAQADKIHELVKNGDTQGIKLLLDKSPDMINLKDQNGDAAIFLAIGNGQVDVMRFLLDKGADVNVKNKFGATPLMASVIAKDPELVKALLENNANVNHTDQKNLTALHYAILNDDPDVATLLIEKGADVNAKDEDGLTPLMKACDRGDLRSVRALIAKGAVVSTKDPHGLTALHIAALNQQDEIVQLLIEKGVRPDAFVEAATGKKVELEKRFAKDKNLIRATFPKDYKWTLLHWAAMTDQRSVATMLIDRGAQVDALDYQDLSALDMAKERDFDDMAKLLSKKGALDTVALKSPNRDKFQKNDQMVPKDQRQNATSVRTLITAVDASDFNEVKELLNQGAKLETKDAKGRTALHIAIMKGQDEVAKFLILRGADVNARDKNGKTPLALAQQMKNAEVIKLLREYGARK